MNSWRIKGIRFKLLCLAIYEAPDIAGDNLGLCYTRPRSLISTRCRDITHRKYIRGTAIGDLERRAHRNESVVGYRIRGQCRDERGLWSLTDGYNLFECFSVSVFGASAFVNLQQSRQKSSFHSGVLSQTRLPH